MVKIYNGRKLSPECLNGIYKDVTNYLGMELAMKVHRHYKGLQVTFPQRFLAREYVSKQILMEFDGTNSKDLARKYGYTERVIRDWLAEEQETI